MNPNPLHGAIDEREDSEGDALRPVSEEASGPRATGAEPSDPARQLPDLNWCVVRPKYSWRSAEAARIVRRTAKRVYFMEKTWSFRGKTEREAFASVADCVAVEVSEAVALEIVAAYTHAGQKKKRAEGRHDAELRQIDEVRDARIARALAQGIAARRVETSEAQAPSRSDKSPVAEGDAPSPSSSSSP